LNAVDDQARQGVDEAAGGEGDVLDGEIDERK
jgi:hypothetical protein